AQAAFNGEGQRENLASGHVFCYFFEPCGSAAEKRYNGGTRICMSTFTMQLQIPEALRELGYSDEDIRRDVPVLLVLKRFRAGAISSGKAADILGITRRDFLDVLAKEGVPIYDPSDDELADEL